MDEARRDERVVGITAAMNSGTGLNILQKELPERYYDVGIAEQHAVLFAAGLALEGAKPVAAIYSTFLQRAYDQIVHDVCLQKPERGVRDGPRRPGGRRRPDPPRRLRHLLPALPAEHGADGAARRGRAGEHAPHGAAATTTARSRCATRAARPRACRCPSRPRPIEIGRGELLREGERVALLGYGYGVPRGARRRGRLADEHGLEPTVADARFAKPLDAELVERLAAEHDVLVTVEENVLPAASARRCSSTWPTATCCGGTRVLRFGLPDRYVTHGKPALLREEVGLTPEAVAERVAEAVLEPTGALA